MSKNLSFTSNAYGILKNMKGGLKDRYRRHGVHAHSLSARGFTIVETMIVLAVTGALFLSAALAISGRQHRTQFMQATQEIRSQIQQAINEVATGYYPNLNNFSCTGIPGSPSGPTFAAGNTEQGGNKGCIFLGKAIQFNVTNTDPEQFRVYTIAALQKNTAGEEISSYNHASPRVVSYPSVEEASDSHQLLYGLTTSEAYYEVDGSRTAIGAIAFVSSLASYSDGAIVSGAQQVKVIPLNNSELNDSIVSAVNDIQGRLDKSPIDPDGVFLCFVSGATDQAALITIGSNGRQLSVTLDVKNVVTDGLGKRTCA
jgi:type II secretory pathway pseudopilin PulG